MTASSSALKISGCRLLKLLFCVLLLMVCENSIAQTQPSYFFLGAKEFDGVQIYDVIQDDKLNYWISTDKGIYVYDSYSFTKKEIQGAVSSELFGFTKNNTGSIFCYNLSNQIICIENGSCSVYYELKPEERSADIYLSVTPQNDLLILTRTLLLFDQNGGRVSLPAARFDYYGFPFLISSSKTISHLADSDTLLVYENRNFRYIKMNTGDQNVTGVLKFFTLNDKIYAIGSTHKQMYRFNETDFSLTPSSPTELEKTKEPYRIYNVNNQAWAAGVTSGVRVLSDEGKITLSGIFYPQYLISHVFQDAEGNLLLSTFNHGILVVPDMNVPDVLNIPQGNSIVSIQKDYMGGMLMGTLTGKLLSLNNGIYTTLSDSGSRPLQSIFSWPGFPFIIFDDGIVRAKHKETGSVTRLTFGSLKDATIKDDSTIYLALNRGLLCVKWKGGNSFEQVIVPELSMRCFSLVYSEADKLLYVSTSDGMKMVDGMHKVTPLLQDGVKIFAADVSYYEGVVFASTKDGVLQCSNGVTGQTIPLSVLGKPVEASKIEVYNGLICAITTEGYAQFDLKGTVVMQLNTQQGFSTNRLYDFDITGDEIWICHSQGVQKLSASSLQVPIAKPLLSFSGFTVNDTITGFLNTPGVYSSDERKFRFVLSSPTLRNKENIRYHYQLSGYDDAWFTSEYSDNEILYNALAPGDYTLTVKAENNGVFSDPVSYTFNISAPFYTTWWFIAGTIVILLLALTLTYRYRLYQQEKKAKLENELAASRLTAIQSQMNPHFIFNSLNSIQDLVLKGDVDNSYTFITKFSNLVRRTLNYSDKDFIEFGQEIKLLELYLSLEKLRFRDDLEFTLDPAGIEDILIPPMLIQPFIENSLVHGLLHKEGKKRLSITFHLNEHLTCVIEDNGIGREKSKEIKSRQRADHESFAGQAIKKRFSILSQIFKSELGYVYEDLYEGDKASGTRVKLTIPVKRNF